MADDLMITIQAWNGERTWRLIGENAFRVWQSTCAFCGAPFTITTARKVCRADQNRKFQIMTCPKHRLTPSECLKLRFSHTSERAAVFEAIKQARISGWHDWACPKFIPRKIIPRAWWPEKRAEARPTMPAVYRYLKERGLR
jgi:hypothetical protein